MKIPRFVYPYDEIRPCVQTDCVIVGGGIAGLYTALEVSKKAKVLILTKKKIEDSNTQRAQGGIAAVFSALDSAELHYQDTCVAGAGLSEPKMVEILVKEGPDRVLNLIEYGIQFDLEENHIALTKEGAHSQRRVLHAQGDATGAEIVRALAARVRQEPNITVLEYHYTMDVWTEQDTCQGVYALTSENEVICIAAHAVVLATGGIGQIYEHTTNPTVATGDGIAIALRAGAVIQDMEFVQFHPTVLNLPAAPRFLISEALRGEGALLRNKFGERFMLLYHEQAELAPRDIVSRAILAEIERSAHPCVYLDITHETETHLQQRFPTIYRTCLQYGLNIAREWIPISPAAHYLMGGIRTDEYGQSNIKGLYACGESACTGVHGANRLASNSLTEAVVFGHRIAEHIHSVVYHPIDSARIASKSGAAPASPGARQVKRELQQQIKLQMQQYAGVQRQGKHLRHMLDDLITLLGTVPKLNTFHREDLEWISMLTCSLLITYSALQREESRGGHYRLDFPQRKDSEWAVHTLLYRDQVTGELKERWINATVK